VDLAEPLAISQGQWVVLTRPARVKPVLYPSGRALRPAYFVEFIASWTDTVRPTATSSRRATERPSSGEISVAHDVFDYRVWADAAIGVPWTAPTLTTPPTLGDTGRLLPRGRSPILIAVEGLNTNPVGATDPWLPSSAGSTMGNNVDAYADRIDPDGYSNGDLRATLTGDHSFDRGYDLTLEPDDSDHQIMAAVTEVFYLTNWMHDWYYDSGFTEAAGNAQQDNFGRGGLGGDRLLAETHNPSEGLNNANMLTPADGESPRLQTFLWTGHDTRVLTVSYQAEPLETGYATFGRSNSI